MNYHNITKCDLLNGDGVRVVLWLSGCSHRCKGCHNPITWDKDGGLLFDNCAKQELFDALDNPDIDGITFSGGDPLFCDNREEVGLLISEISKKFSNKTIWLYTGYLWEEIKHLDFIKFVDVLVDGKFQAELLDNSLLWKGSSNQRVIDVKSSLQCDECVLYCENKTEKLMQPTKCKNCC